MKFNEIFVRLGWDKKNKKKTAFFGSVWGELKANDGVNCTAVLTGKGLMVVDVDTKDLAASNRKLAKLLGDPTVETAKGFHYYFTGDVEDIAQTQGLFPGVDIRNEGGLVFNSYWGASKHISYKKVGKVQVMNKKLRKFLIKAGKEKSAIDTTEYNAIIATGKPWEEITQGEQHHGLNLLCQAAFKAGLSRDEVYAKHNEYIDNYLVASEHEHKLRDDRIEWASKTFEGGRSLEGEQLDQPDPAAVPAVIEGEVIEPFVTAGSYEDAINDAADLRESDKMAAAVQAIKVQFKVPIAQIREDITRRVAEMNPEKLIYPDYEYTLQGELRYLSTMDNLEVLFERMKLKPYYDVILKDVIIEGRKMKKDNAVTVLRSDVYSEAVKTGLSPSIIDVHYDPFMVRKEKNPLLDAVKAVKWDGKDHLKKLSKCIHVTGNDKYKREGLKRWLIQCVAAWDTAKDSGYKGALAKYELILVMQSKQGIKKTSFFGRLLPGKLKKYFMDGASLHVKDKDSVMSLLGHGIVELGELDATFKKSDISDIKSFTSRQTDKIRPPYGRDLLVKPRRTSMCSSVNDAQFLNDPSGARRFFVLALEALDQKGLDSVDMMQVWAQVWALYKGGAKWWFDAGEKWVKIRDEENEVHRETGLYGDIVLEFAAKILSGHIYPAKMLASYIFETVLDKKPSQTEAVSFARELTAAGLHRNTAKYYTGFKSWAEGYKDALDN